VTKIQVQIQMCALTSTVAEKVFKCRKASDCFCGETVSKSGYAFDPEVLEFIKTAVEEKIDRDAQ